MQTPIVSIIIPVHNAEQYIAQTLKSILQEEEIALEVIVVNDKSIDLSVEHVQAIRDPRVRLLDGPGKGISACLNCGLAVARGSVIMRCDADDIYPESRIKQQVNWLARNPEFGGVCGGFATIDAVGRHISDMSCGSDATEITAELVSGYARTHLGTYAIRSALLAKLDGFREYFEMGEDLDLQFRLGSVGRIAYLPETWYFYRIHSSSIIHSQRVDRVRFFEKMAKEFCYQRKSLGFDDLQIGLSSPPPNSGLSTSFTAAEHIQGVLLGRAWNEYKNGLKVQSLLTGARAVVANPTSLAAWKSITFLVLSLLRLSRK